MNAFRFAALAVYVSLIVPFGSASASTNYPPPPPNHS